jgi:hypothetical protein
MENDVFIVGLRTAVEAGARSLGGEFFAQNHGSFWGNVLTRLNMRARFERAEQLRDVDLPGEAVAEYEALLELNPGDNQNAREPLLGLYLKIVQMNKKIV